MDPNLWSKLPTDLIRWIIEHSSPSIDTQLTFKIRPKKITEARAWRLWYLLKSHDGLVYNLETDTLHNFRIPGLHTVRRPVSLVIDDDLWIFNQEEAIHSLEVYSSNGGILVTPQSDQWITELRVLLRGSGLARAINFHQRVLTF
jgi:hypothetical protein